MSSPSSNVLIVVDKNLDFSSKVIPGSKGQLKTKRRREKATLLTASSLDFSDLPNPEPPPCYCNDEHNCVMFIKSDQNLAQFENEPSKHLREGISEDDILRLEFCQIIASNKSYHFYTWINIILSLYRIEYFNLLCNVSDTNINLLKTLEPF